MELYNRSFESKYGLIRVRVVDDCPKLLLQIDDGDIILTDNWYSQHTLKIKRTAVMKAGREFHISHIGLPEDISDEAFAALKGVKDKLSKNNKLDKTANIIFLTTQMPRKEQKRLFSIFVCPCIPSIISIGVIVYLWNAESISLATIFMGMPVLLSVIFAGVWAATLYAISIFYNWSGCQKACWANNILFVDADSKYEGKREQDIQSAGATIRKAIFIIPVILFMIYMIYLYFQIGGV